MLLRRDLKRVVPEKLFGFFNVGKSNPLLHSDFLCVLLDELLFVLGGYPLHLRSEVIKLRILGLLAAHLNGHSKRLHAVLSFFFVVAVVAAEGVLALRGELLLAWMQIGCRFN